MTEPRFFYKKHTFAVAAIATATNRSIQNQLHQPSLFPLISGQSVGEMIRSAWQIEIKMMHCSVFLRLHFLHVCPSCRHLFRGKMFSFPQNAGGHSTMVNVLESKDLWSQSCYLQCQDDYPSSPAGSTQKLLDKKIICQKLHREDDWFWIGNRHSYLQLLWLPPSHLSPAVQTRWDTGSCFVSTWLEETFYILTYFLYFTAVSMQ